MQGSHMGTLTCRNRDLEGLPGSPRSCAVGVPGAAIHLVQLKA